MVFQKQLVEFELPLRIVCLFRMYCDRTGLCSDGNQEKWIVTFNCALDLVIRMLEDFSILEHSLSILVSNLHALLLLFLSLLTRPHESDANAFSPYQPQSLITQASTNRSRSLNSPIFHQTCSHIATLLSRILSRVQEHTPDSLPTFPTNILNEMLRCENLSVQVLAYRCLWQSLPLDWTVPVCTDISPPAFSTPKYHATLTLPSDASLSSLLQVLLIRTLFLRTQTSSSVDSYEFSVLFESIDILIRVILRCVRDAKFPQDIASSWEVGGVLKEEPWHFPRTWLGEFLVSNAESSTSSSVSQLKTTSTPSSDVRSQSAQQQQLQWLEKFAFFVLFQCCSLHPILVRKWFNECTDASLTTLLDRFATFFHCLFTVTSFLCD